MSKQHGQHFLLSRQAKTLSLASVFRMSDAEAERAFRQVRWSETDGEPVCPKCGCVGAYEFRRETGALVFQCRDCKAQFSITSGTLFASHKLPLRMYLAAIAVFCNEVKGKSMLAMSRDLGLSYKAAFVLCHKMREAMATEFRGRELGWRRRRGVGRWSVLRRLCEAGEPHRKPPGSPPRREPNRQAPRGRHHPPARRRQPAGRLSL